MINSSRNWKHKPRNKKDLLQSISFPGDMRSTFSLKRGYIPSSKVGKMGEDREQGERSVTERMRIRGKIGCVSYSPPFCVRK